jgi:hypothetical protein
MARFSSNCMRQCFENGRGEGEVLGAACEYRQARIEEKDAVICNCSQDGWGMQVLLNFEQLELQIVFS